MVEPTPITTAAPATPVYVAGDEVQVWWAQAWRAARVVAVGPSAHVAAEMPFVDASSVVLLRLADPELAPRVRDDGWDLIIPSAGSELLRHRPPRRTR